MGGGAVDQGQSDLVFSIVVLAKNWRWASTVLAAGHLLSCCSPASRMPAWLKEELIIPTEADQSGTGNPLVDDG